VRNVRASGPIGARVATGRPLEFRTHTGVIEGLMPDPRGTLTVEIPGDVVGDLATIVAIDFEPAP